MKVSITIVFLFFSLIANSQTHRDTLVSKIYNSYIQSNSDYVEIKNDIDKLKKIDTKYNAEILNHNLEVMFKYNDIAFFKESLVLLVLRYGYNVSYLSGNENYYKAIIHGELSPWFKKMYLKNHTKWLETNLDKLVNIQTLNTLNDKDQYAHKALLEVINHAQLTKTQYTYVKQLDDDYFLQNANTLVNITKSIGYIPTGESYALIQKPYDLVEIHSFQQNFTTFFDMIYPYYKKSYLKHDLPIIKFKNIDSFKFLADKNQIFGLLSIEDIPETLREEYNVKSIESADINLTNKYREDLKWF